MASDYCNQCGRPLVDTHMPTRSHRPVVEIVAEHGDYGCESGCCGFRFYGRLDDGGAIQVAGFDFSHSEAELKDTLDALGKHFNCANVRIGDTGCGLY